MSDSGATAERQRSAIWVAFLCFAGVAVAYSARSIRSEMLTRERTGKLRALELPSDGVGVSLPSHIQNPKIKKGISSLLVAMGNCDGCSKNKFDPDKISQGYEQVILVWAADKPAKMNLPARFILATDPEGTFHERINAQLTPRIYDLSSNLVITRPDGGNEL